MLMAQHPPTSQFKNSSTSFIILLSFIMFSPNIKSLAQFSLCFWNMFVCLLFPFHSHNHISPFHQSTKHTVTNKCSLKSEVYHVTLFCFKQMNKPYLKKGNSHIQESSVRTHLSLIISSTTQLHVYTHKIPDHLIHYYSNVLLPPFLLTPFS